MPDRGSTLEYYIASKGQLIIITFVGSFKNCQEVVEQCSKEITEHSCGVHNCIIYARDISEVHANSYRDLVQLQNTLRSYFNVIKVCSLHPSIKNILLAAGVVRMEELTNNLKDTVMDINKRSHFKSTG